MTREQLEHAIRAAGAIGDLELYVVGSQAILGAVPKAHPDLCRSMEVDIAPRNRIAGPPKISRKRTQRSQKKLLAFGI
jgi:hypothetical protein